MTSSVLINRPFQVYNDSVVFFRGLYLILFYPMVLLPGVFCCIERCHFPQFYTAFMFCRLGVMWSSSLSSDPGLNSCSKDFREQWAR
jgi:hypothetical protein